MLITADGGETEEREESLESINCKLCDFFHRISHFSDTNVVLDSVLNQARALSNADAGTIYLLENNSLVFPTRPTTRCFQARKPINTPTLTPACPWTPLPSPVSWPVRAVS